MAATASPSAALLRYARRAMQELRQISRMTLLRDAAVFQGKLFLDGLRDLLLVPVSLFAALISWLHAGGGAGTAFYEVVRFGRRSERWIDLFAAAERIGEAHSPNEQPTLDELIERIERGLVEQYERNGGRLGVGQLHEALNKIKRSFGRNAE